MQNNFGKEIMELLLKRYGKDIHTSLRHRNSTELFVAALLSPQCTDVQVNNTTSRLFKKYRKFEDYANANIKELRRDLNTLNFYNTKAKYLTESSSAIVKRFDGKIPSTISELTSLKGVGRKVANVVLNSVYNINEGIAVDTHCITVSRRLGFAKTNDPKKIEKALMAKIPNNYWGVASNLLIALGRDTCTSRRKYCSRCVLRDICPSSTSVSKRKS
ncbi:MAG: endonuclease III domain-containing protein [Candidatus Micrarchaeia archaeon]